MPVPKRWFPVSRDFNDDPELWELTHIHGDRALRIWLEILAILDRSDNLWKLSGHWKRTLAIKTRTKSTTVSSVIVWCIAKGWLVVAEESMGGSPLVYSTPNYLKYHRTRGANGNQTSSPPSLPDPTLHNKKEKKDESFFLLENDMQINKQIKSLEEIKISTEWEHWAKREKSEVDLVKELEKFKDHHRAYRPPCHDYKAAFKGWLRKAESLSWASRKKPPKQKGIMRNKLSL